MILALDFGTTYLKYIIKGKTTTKDTELIANVNTENKLLCIINNLISKNNICVDSIEEIKITGAKASFFNNKNICGIKTTYISEFQALVNSVNKQIEIGKYIITSCGTGTSIIFVNGDEWKHISGTGLGGGSILGLIRNEDFQNIIAMAENGSLDNCDICIKDISKVDIGFLNKNLTCSNMGKCSYEYNKNTISKEDYSLGILNMVYQNIAIISTLASSTVNVDDIIVTGYASDNSIAKQIINSVGKLYNKKFTFLNNSKFTVVEGCLV